MRAKIQQAAHLCSVCQALCSVPLLLLLLLSTLRSHRRLKVGQSGRFVDEALAARAHEAKLFCHLGRLHCRIVPCVLCLELKLLCLHNEGHAVSRYGGRLYECTGQPIL
jgi:hypothetical protein